MKDDGNIIKTNCLTRVKKVMGNVTIMTLTFSFASFRVSASIHFKLGKLSLKASLISSIISRAISLDSPLKTDLTNMAPSENPMTLLVSETQYLQGLSDPSDPIKARRNIFAASRNSLDRVIQSEWATDHPK